MNAPNDHEPPSPDLITIERAASLLACSTRQIWRLIDAGELAVFRRGRLVRVIRESVNAFVLRHAAIAALKKRNK